jgi:hypothetical protein
MIDIAKELEGLFFTWSPKAMGDEVTRHDATARAYVGHNEGDKRWSLLVVSFDAGRAGRGYDGTATCAERGLIVRLPRSLAAELYKRAAS